MNKPADHAPGGRDRWYQQPVAWLGVAITLLLLGACIWTVVISMQYTDVPMHDADASMLLGVPASSAERGTEGS